ncbi:inhibitor of nuclear factor kappa-B kinase-interacting protein isoform X1 [Hyla sarda]|uniref:inhibitor of nuclear factor kappa-B kinase-interacting protein isoform X1 n=1 Tax=Hyla sarda TaxID=327740 RepID=UPI0024C3BCCB|nr:inhibitor of nuclear factor kappa-B kinase-interacting protein isoform X1 [Hyla sarda]XP_056373290.1 inhibitor of nuclear factor kappa-B kinase-interacting protein isoform X1 [Hyla sarda]
MSGEAKQRKKGGSPSIKEPRDGAKNASGQQPQKKTPLPGNGSSHLDFRTALCTLCLAVCGALTWIVFQQSQNFTLLEQKYQSLQSSSSALQELEDKVGQMFGKLVSTDAVLADATSSSSLVSNLQQQLTNLYNEIDLIQVRERSLSEKMQTINLRFQNVTDSWKKSLDEMNLETDSVKSEAKSFHNQMTLKVNSADQTLKQLSEKLKEFESGTLRNFRTVKTQEDDDLQRMSEILEWDDNAVKEMEKEQNDLANINEEVLKSMAEFQPKLTECIQHLPTVETAVRSLLKVSSEMQDLDKKVNTLTEQVFNTEDNLLKIITETLEIQHTLERMQYDNSILKLQNDVSVLKEKADILLKVDEKPLSEENEPDES